MNIVRFPPVASWDNLLKRPVQSVAAIEKIVEPILADVKSRGDLAVAEYTEKFEDRSGLSFVVGQSVLENSVNHISKELKNAIDIAYQNIKLFHESQKEAVKMVETMPGVVCWRRSKPIQKVGIYIPGGTAPLFSTVLMLGVPAQIAGCSEVVLCSPSDHPAIYYAATLVGVTKVFRIGGAQAVAAMAYGTETVPACYKLFGPGNQFVTSAKMLVSKEGIAIDMPAGPSEVAVYGDETSNAVFIAADLLSQTEHGVDSQVVLVTTSEELLEKVTAEVHRQLEDLSRKEIAKAALDNSTFILFSTKEKCVSFLNAYAAEHLILAVDAAEEIAEKITDAGSIFLGHYTPESCGDYASGTNHTLPTNGYARAYSGVSLDSFVKKITYQKISREGLRNIGPVVELLAANEQLDAHKNAVTVRLDSLVDL